MKDYKEILKGVIDINNTTKNGDIGSAICAYIYEQCPELIENEDERIRKSIINFLKEFEKDHYRNLDFNSWIIWLKNQGEQNKQQLHDIIIILWDLLDKIDTFSELKITDTNPDNPFSKIMHITQERHKFVKSDGYNLFINDVKITNRKGLEKPTDIKTYDVKPHIPNGSIDYDQTYEEAQEYLSERGFDIPWNDGDVFVDEKYISQTVANVLAWGDTHPKQNFEKQGEQKPTNKVEPKFKIGDWVILFHNHNSLYQIEKIENYQYTLRHILGGSMTLSFSLENNIKSWTIEDAKDGDVLYINNTLSESIIIYKSFNNGIIKKYASYNKFGFEGESYLALNDGYINPATKEQREILFSKMTENGYEWDIKKKELKINQNLIEY